MDISDTEKKIIRTFVIKYSEDNESHSDIPLSNDDNKATITKEKLVNSEKQEEKIVDNSENEEIDIIKDPILANTENETSENEKSLLNGIFSHIKNVFAKNDNHISIQLVNNNCFGNKNNIDTKFLSKKIGKPLTMDIATICELLEKIPEEKLKLIPFEKLPPIIIINNINNNIKGSKNSSIQVKK